MLSTVTFATLAAVIAGTVVCLLDIMEDTGVIYFTTAKNGIPDVLEDANGVDLTEAYFSEPTPDGVSVANTRDDPDRWATNKQAAFIARFGLDGYKKYSAEINKLITDAWNKLVVTPRLRTKPSLFHVIKNLFSSGTGVAPGQNQPPAANAGSASSSSSSSGGQPAPRPPVSSLNLNIVEDSKLEIPDGAPSRPCTQTEKAQKKPGCFPKRSYDS